MVTKKQAPTKDILAKRNVQFSQISSARDLLKSKMGKRKCTNQWNAIEELLPEINQAINNNYTWQEVSELLSSDEIGIKIPAKTLKKAVAELANGATNNSRNGIEVVPDVNANEALQRHTDKKAIAPKILDSSQK